VPPALRAAVPGAFTLPARGSGQSENRNCAPGRACWRVPLCACGAPAPVRRGPPGAQPRPSLAPRPPSGGLPHPALALALRAAAWARCGPARRVVAWLFPSGGARGACAPPPRRGAALRASFCRGPPWARLVLPWAGLRCGGDRPSPRPPLAGRGRGMVVAGPAVPRFRSTPKAQKKVPDAPRLTPSNCVKPVDFTQFGILILPLPS